MKKQIQVIDWLINQHKMKFLKKLKKAKKENEKRR